MNRLSSSLQSVETIVVCVTSVLVFFYAVYYPLVHWDQLAYAGVAYDWLGHDFVTVHTMVYQELKEHAPAAEIDALINFDEYRSTMHADPEAFQQQLPYYSCLLYTSPSPRDS